MLKINSDATFDNKSNFSCSGVVIRDDKGNLLGGSYRKHAASSSLSSEALALREAVALAKNLNLEKVVFESDCLELVKACRGEIIKDEIAIIVKDINILRQGFSCCGFMWCSRKGNELAHNIAHLASVPSNWVYHWPFVLKNIILRDKDLSISDGDCPISAGSGSAE